MRVVVGVGGGIAAYKAASLVRLFTESGHEVTVVPTEAALEFVGAPTWEALSGKPVHTSVFEAVDTVNHVRLGHLADLVVVAPATADLLARAAHGLANDLLTNTLLMAHCPVLFAPAMHSEMWAHPATAANAATLRAHGRTVMEPGVGRLTGSDSGPGRLPEPEEIFTAALALITMPDVGSGLPLSGAHVVVTAGGTVEPLDPVRFLGNRSSGKQGLALARAALAAGARVTLIAGDVDVPLDSFAAAERAEVVRIETALQLQHELTEQFPETDILIMAAAVADFRPDHAAMSKIKKRDDGANPVITLVRNPDILASLVQQRNQSGGSQYMVGFAAETGDDQHSALEYAAGKLARKGTDLLVMNEVGAGVVFGQDRTKVSILAAGRDPQEVAGSKDEVAAAIIRRIVAENSNPPAPAQ